MQSSGEVAMVLRAGNYFMHVRAVVPKGYPAEALNIEVSDSNLPDALVRLEAAKITDIAQKMAEYRTPESDVQAAQARAGAGEAATSKAEKLAREGKQTVVSFNKGQVRFFSNLESSFSYSSRLRKTVYRQDLAKLLGSEIMSIPMC